MKAHATDTVSLVFALIFAALVGAWGVDRATDVNLDGRWYLVIALVVVALITLISTLARKKPAPVATPIGAGAAAFGPTTRDDVDEVIEPSIGTDHVERPAEPDFLGGEYRETATAVLNRDGSPSDDDSATGRDVETDSGTAIEPADQAGAGRRATSRTPRRSAGRTTPHRDCGRERAGAPGARRRAAGHDRGPAGQRSAGAVPRPGPVPLALTNRRSPGHAPRPPGAGRAASPAPSNPRTRSNLPLWATFSRSIAEKMSPEARWCGALPGGAGAARRAAHARPRERRTPGPARCAYAGLAPNSWTGRYMSDGSLLRLPHSGAAPVSTARRLSSTAVATLTSEVTRHPGPKRVLVVADSPEVTDFVLDDLMPADRLVIWATDASFAAALEAELAGDRRRLASRVTVVTEGSEIDEESIDVAVVATPVTGDADSALEALDRYRSLLRADGVLSVATGATPSNGGGAAQALQEAAASYGVRADLVVRNRPPLRVHHLRFSPADPALAERLEPAYTPSHVPVTERMGIDSNGVVAAGIFGGLALLTRRIRPKSKAWLVPALAAPAVAAFFRDPRRITPNDPNAVVAASDGVVLSVERVKDDRFGAEEWLRIAVFLSVLDVHINRSPVAGRVVDIICEEGGYAMAQSAAAEHNVAQYTVLETSRGRAVVAQRTGLIARRIVNRARVGSLLARGERYGLIRFGSRTDVYLPVDAVEPMVAPGDRVVGAETVIARYL